MRVRKLEERKGIDHWTPVDIIAIVNSRLQLALTVLSFYVPSKTQRASICRPQLFLRYDGVHLVSIAAYASFSGL